MIPGLDEVSIRAIKSWMRRFVRTTMFRFHHCKVQRRRVRFFHIATARCFCACRTRQRTATRMMARSLRHWNCFHVKTCGNYAIIMSCNGYESLLSCAISSFQTAAPNWYVVSSPPFSSSLIMLPRFSSSIICLSAVFATTFSPFLRT